MKITDEILDHISNLARLKVHESEREKLKGDMTAILEWVEKLNEVDTNSVEPLVHMSNEINRVRSEKKSVNLSKEDAMKNSPASNIEYFVVPKVIDKGK